MKPEDIKRIAEGVGYEIVDISGTIARVRNPLPENPSDYDKFFASFVFSFDPLNNDGDAFKVLEAFIEHEKNIKNAGSIVHKMLVDLWSMDNKREAICLAYLNLLGE